MSLHIATKTQRIHASCSVLRFPKPTAVYYLHARYQSNATLKANNGSATFPDSTLLKKHTTNALARLPLTSIIRSLVLGAFFTTPLLSRPGIALLGWIAQSRSPFLNPDKNFLVKAAVKPLIYNHFCAGTGKAEIQHNVSTFKKMGYCGVILAYGKEFDPTKVQDASALDEADLKHWKKGNLETLDMLQDGDVLGLKFTGAGKSVTDALRNGADPPKAFTAAMDAIVDGAIARNTRIFIDSEQDEFQYAIDQWIIDLMRRHNRDGKVFIYNTIQAYLKQSRQKLEHQLQLAQAEGWTLAFKLVRGAYIETDPRHIIHDTKEQTDECYNSIARDLLTGNISGVSKTDFPRVDLFLAGHNTESVAKATSLVCELSAKGELKTVPEFGQLQGMSDSLGCKILQEGEAMKEAMVASGKPVVCPKVYKWSVWGSVQECMQYLVRRAVENRGATERMGDGMAELAKELRRRAGDKMMRR